MHLKCCKDTCLFNALDATWNKLHLKRFLSKFNRNRLRLVWKSKVKCERDFLQFHRCKHAVMHLLNCISRMQSEIEQRPFWFRRKFEKRALLFYRVFRNLSFGNLPGFLWCEAIRIPAFSIFKKGAGFQLLIISRSPVIRRAAFLFSESITSV